MTDQLRARGVGLRYGRRVALDDVSLSLRAGELAVLVGPNGSGKTSLLEVLLGARRPELGEVELDGRRLHDLPPAERARSLTLVPQSFEPRFDFSVAQLVEMGRSAWLGSFEGLGAKDRQAIDRALVLTRTSELRGRSIHELSAGERQRVQLARALAQEPQVLLLDEPLANLDAAHELELLSILRDFVDRGGAVLMTLHDLTLATRHADRLLVIDRGRLVADGSAHGTLTPELLASAFGIATAAKPRVTFVIGGARSGKSRYAATLARTWSENPVYLATSRKAVDDLEHRRRIERHQADRGPEWSTVEEDMVLSRPRLDGRVVVVDCLTLWLANCFADARLNLVQQAEDPCDSTLRYVRAELDRTLAGAATWILVSNEIGQGVHAMTEIGRQFTDLQGFVNQHAAARADRVVSMVAGLPHAIKGPLPAINCP